MKRARSRTWRVGAFALWMSGATLVVGVASADTTPEPHVGKPAVMDRVIDQLERSLVPRCLTPDVERAMSEVVAAGALEPVLGDDLTLAKADIGAGAIELAIRDTAQTYSVTLALPGERNGKPDETGKRFAFYLAANPAPPPRAAAALLAIARLFDDAIPDTAIVRCAGVNAPRAERRYPRALALVSAVAEAFIVLAAVAYGLRALRTIT